MTEIPKGFWQEALGKATAYVNGDTESLGLNELEEQLDGGAHDIEILRALALVARKANGDFDKPTNTGDSR